MSPTPKYSIELLAPARDREVGIEAIRHGADAVYMGASGFGARAAASNSLGDVAAVVDYAHQFNARVYVTVNTIIYEDELRAVEAMIRELWKIGVDALIVQDLGVLRLDIPPIALHASTQCDIRTPATARFLQDLGFSQLVLPRELTLDEIRQMREAVDVPLEAFVHGALCVSYSGDCYASQVHTGRSANRGACAQLCRLPYDLTDGRGRVLAKGKHLLSLRDLNRLDDLEALIGAGVSSLKIEGRLKDAAYVKNVVAAYDRELRRLGVSRTSRGDVEVDFEPDVRRSFNRGFTSYFFRDKAPRSIASIHTPKSLGMPVASVSEVRGRKVVLKIIKEPLANGDGITFFTRDGLPGGFRVNFVEPHGVIRLNEPAPAELKPGMTLYRNFDKLFTDRLSAPTAERFIKLKMTVRRASGMLCLEADRVTVSLDYPDVQPAKTDQREARKRVLGKLGDTIYRLEELDDRLGAEFVPASVLADLRRLLVTALSQAGSATRHTDLRRPENPVAKAPQESLTYHSNVANTLAESVYRDHGVTGPIESALETVGTSGRRIQVMDTRYCLRRELGHCLLTPEGSEWAEPLTLTAPGLTLHPRFHCGKNCHMTIETD